MITKPQNTAEVQSIVNEAELVQSRGGGTKSTLSMPFDDCTTIEMTSISGVEEYEPEEYTITALAGTRIADINRVLSEYGQYLPYDPPMVDQGATIAGSVASGLSGPGRYRYGGVRDFLLGVKYVNASGELIRGGGKVVKNAAGFDLAKLMIGSLGVFGVIVESTLKVFPAPEESATLKIDYDELDEALQALFQASVTQLDIASIELTPAGHGYSLYLRLSGLAKPLPQRTDRLYKMFDRGTLIQGQEEGDIWMQLREFSWVPQEWVILKLSIIPEMIPAIEANLNGTKALRKYSCAGQVGWLAVEELNEEVEKMFFDNRLTGLVIRGPSKNRRLGANPSESFYRRVKSALDPNNRFMEV